MPDQDVQNRFLELPEDYREFLVSDYLRDVASVIKEEYNLNESQALVFENGLILFLLFMINESDFMTLLKKEGVGELLTVKILDNLQFVLPQGLFEKENNLVTEDIKKLEHEIASLDGIRTMANDMQSRRDDGTHTSNQDDLLNRQGGDTPRWETDTRS